MDTVRIIATATASSEIELDAATSTTLNLITVTYATDTPATEAVIVISTLPQPVAPAEPIPFDANYRLAVTYAEPATAIIDSHLMA